MAKRVNPPTRPYRSAVRAEQAQRTQQRILDAAKRLFLERGYVGTTIASIAAEAGITPETIYLSLGSKRVLLERVIETTILGPEAVPLAQQHAMDDIKQLPTARERLGAIVEFACAVLARTSPIHLVIRGAADSEAFAVELRSHLLRERLGVYESVFRMFFADSLRPGLTMRQAVERCAGLASPELHHLLTVELGWTAEQHRDWLRKHLEFELLGTE